ncbi:hypothetical protein BJY52DRAFT_1230174 [Lactarius psammicola]|nr:hypothetical protein BJY52DRAFT_1230174 [Lactarius psammicola]
MPASSARKANPQAVEPQERVEKKVTKNDTPSELVGEGIPSTVPTNTTTAPKKRGRKPKPVAAKVDNTPAVTGPEAVNQPASNTVNGRRDPLPPRGGRNTHPGQQIGVQPTPRRSSQEVEAERERKRLELKERLQAAEEAKRALAQMALEDEMAEEAVEEEGRQRLVRPNKKKNISKVSSLEEVFDLDNVSGDEEEDDSEPSGVEVKQRRKAFSKTELRNEIQGKTEALRAAGGRKKAKATAHEGEGANVPQADLLPKKYNNAGAKPKATMGYFFEEPIIGGLDDEHAVAERPVSFGPISSQAMPVIPPGLQRDRHRGNKLAGLTLSTTIKGVEDSDENDGVTQAIVYPRANAASGVQVNSYKVPRKQAQAKLKIRAAAAQHQHGSLPVVVPACTNGPTDEYFLVQHTWVKPFQDFTSKSPSFVAIVQQAFNATHPNISYVVTAHNDIVATAFERVKTKRSLIASDVLKLVKNNFEDDRYVDQSQEVKKYAWWALRPDGPAYYANPTPMDCSLDRTSSNYVGKYQSRFIIPVAKKFLSFADQSAISPKLDARNPPLGLYILILTAVRNSFSEL